MAEAYDREKDIQKVMASNAPDMTYEEAAAQVDRNSKLNANLTKSFLGGGGGIPTNLFNGNLEDLVKKTGAKNLKNAGDTAQITREATLGSKIGLKINETAGGFKSMTVTTDEGEKVTVEPTVAMMTAGVDGGGIQITKTSTKGTEISTLTGSTSSNGFLKMMFTQGSPKGIEKTLEATGQVSPEQIKLKIKETSSNPAVAEENVGVENPNEKVTAKVETVTKETNKAIANPFGALTNALSGSAGLDFGNILGQIGGIIGGSLKKGGVAPNTTAIAPVASSAITPETNSAQSARNLQLNKDLTAGVSNLLGIQLPMPTGGNATSALTQPNTSKIQLPSIPNTPSVPTNIIDEKGNTNVSKVVDKSDVTNDLVKPTDEPVKVGKRTIEWNGAATDPAAYTYVNSPEELELEFRSMYQYGLRAKFPPTCALIFATRTGLNQDVDQVWCADFHEKSQRKWLDAQADKGVVSKEFARISGGTQFHYLIRRDGSIQRGRPFDMITLIPKAFRTFVDRSITIGFAGGLNTNYPYEGGKDQYISQESYTAKQWETYEKMLTVFRKVMPSFEAISQDDLLNKPTIGFSAIEWSKQRFGWDTAYVGENTIENRYKNYLGPLTVVQLNATVPENVAKPTVTPIVTKPPAPPPPEKVAEETTGAPPKKSDPEKEANDNRQKEIEKRLDKIEKEIKSIEQSYKTVSATPEPFASLVKKDLLSRVEILKAERKALEAEASSYYEDRYDSPAAAGANYRKAQSETLAAKRAYNTLEEGLTLFSDIQKTAKFGSTDLFLKAVSDAKRKYDDAVKAEEEAKKKYEAAVDADEQRESR